MRSLWLSLDCHLDPKLAAVADGLFHPQNESIFRDFHRPIEQIYGLSVVREAKSRDITGKPANRIGHPSNQKQGTQDQKDCKYRTPTQGIPKASVAACFSRRGKWEAIKTTPKFQLQF